MDTYMYKPVISGNVHQIMVMTHALQLISDI